MQTFNLLCENEKQAIEGFEQQQHAAVSFTLQLQYVHRVCESFRQNVPKFWRDCLCASFPLRLLYAEVCSRTALFFTNSMYVLKYFEQIVDPYDLRIYGILYTVTVIKNVF